MRYYAFLETLDPAAQRALLAAFTMGARHLHLLTRLQQADAAMAVVLGTLAAAHVALSEASAMLSAASDWERGGGPPLRNDLFALRRAELEATAGREVVRTWLTIAAEAAHDAALAARRDAEVAVVVEALGAALHALAVAQECIAEGVA
jgi:hypothetical protein